MVHFRKICIFMQFLSKSIPIQSYFSIILIEDLSAYDTNLIHKNCKKTVLCTAEWISFKMCAYKFSYYLANCENWINHLLRNDDGWICILITPNCWNTSNYWFSIFIDAKRRPKDCIFIEKYLLNCKPISNKWELKKL